ncbi:MAG: ATP synthase F1 subunit epsilon [Candidatus Falkowbacteria bacterium]|nr:ATP synthase F1 subunit epsilon [Candidatus Falkowbacteria bacterium]
MSDNKTIQFEIVTPEKRILRENITQVIIPTQSGEITVLPNHIPLVSNLKPGVIIAKKNDGSEIIMAVSGGFVEVTKDKIIILADTAERADELDENRIKEARAKAELAKEELKHVDREQFAQIAAKLQKELARENAVKKWRKL